MEVLSFWRFSHRIQTNPRLVRDDKAFPVTVSASLIGYPNFNPNKNLLGGSNRAWRGHQTDRSYDCPLKPTNRSTFWEFIRIFDVKLAHEWKMKCNSADESSKEVNDVREIPATSEPLPASFSPCPFYWSPLALATEILFKSWRFKFFKIELKFLVKNVIRLEISSRKCRDHFTISNFNAKSIW